MVLENKYLRNAIQKAGYVVLVKTCHINERKSKLIYISPNASMVGMNVELLNKGLRLTEDYIFPEDREKVIQTVISAIEAKVDDYVHEYRMVGDDGRLYHVSNEICVSGNDGDTFTVEFYIRDITESKRDKTPDSHIRYRSSSSVLNKAKEQMDDIENLSENEKVESMMKVFSKLSKLYSVFVDAEGKIVYPPTGPAQNIGNFYDLFEKPAYKEYYKYIRQMVLDNNAPSVFDREEGGAGKISAAPISVDGELKGLWILGSYTEEESEKLKKISESHWTVAEIISDLLYKSRVIEVEAAKSRGAGMKLREELARQSIVNGALTKINSKLIDSVEQVVEETFKDVGLHLNIDKMFLYTFGQEQNKEYRLRSYWDVSGKAPGDDLLTALPERMYMVEDGVKRGEGQYVVDNANITETDKLNLMRYNFKAIIVYPVYLNDRLYGMLFFAECKTERVWTKEEMRFTQSIALVVQNMLENAEGDDNIRNVNKHLIETYNNFNVGIFVRDTYSGEVLFSNAEMNRMLGYDFTGGDSRVILTDLHDRFDNITGMRKPFITKEKVVNWRSYIQSLDNIMDITEVKIEWLHGEPASLIILRKAKDF